MGDLVNKEYLSKQFAGYSTVVKEQLDKKIDIQQNVANANKILGIGEDGKVVPVEAPSSVKVSAETDNQITQKDDGIYVAPTDLSNYVEKEDGKGLFSGNYNDLENKPSKLSDFTDDIHVELTQEEYDALSDEEKNNGTVYFVTDEEDETIYGINASDVSYDDTSTSLGTDNIQSAIEKLNDSKVNKEDGMGLSQESFTTEEKEKLNGIEENANNYEHPTDAGYKHIPSGGSSGQALVYSSAGTAKWASSVSQADNADACNNIHMALLSYTDSAKATVNGLELNLYDLISAASINTLYIVGVSYIGCRKSGAGGSTTEHKLLSNTGYIDENSYAYMSSPSDYMNHVWYFNIKCSSLGSTIIPTYYFIVYYTD